MTHNYKITSTSKISAAVEDRVLSESTTTRKVLRPEIIDNPHDQEAAVKVAIVCQRRRANDEWEDVPSESLRDLKAGEIFKLPLSSSETLVLREELEKLYSIHAAKGVMRGERTVVVGFEDEMIHAAPSRMKAIKALLAHNHSQEFWDELVKHDEELATNLCLGRLQAERKKALKVFESEMKNKNNEDFWQKYFEQNTWIFGYGLKYHFIQQVQAQANYGGSRVDRRGEQKGDILAATSSEDARFTVLVEIKRPDTLLLGKEYRNGAFVPSDDLCGGKAQLQVNCRKWEIEGSRLEGNQDMMDELGCAPIVGQPNLVFV